jgi:hypothetical protein
MAFRTCNCKWWTWTRRPSSRRTCCARLRPNEDSYLLYVSKREEERASDALDQKRIANVAIAVPPAIPTLPLQLVFPWSS